MPEPLTPAFAGYEPAVCATGAGLAVWPGVHVVELRGPEPVLDELALRGDAIADWFRVSAHRALAVRAPDPAEADVWVGEVATRAVPVVIAGPRADLVARRLEAEAPVMALEPESGGVRLLVAGTATRRTAEGVIRAGRRHGAISVSRHAAHCHLAAHRQPAGAARALPTVAA